MKSCESPLVPTICSSLIVLLSIASTCRKRSPPFQGYTARNITLSDVASLTGLERMEVRQLFLTKPSESKDVESLESREGPIQEGKLAILTNNMELRSAGEAFSVNSQTGTLTVPRLGPHAVLGDVDYLGNTIRNAVLRGPDIRQV